MQYNNWFDAKPAAAVDDNSIATHRSIDSMCNSAVCDGIQFCILKVTIIIIIVVWLMAVFSRLCIGVWF